MHFPTLILKKLIIEREENHPRIGGEDMSAPTYVSYKSEITESARPYREIQPRRSTQRSKTLLTISTILAIEGSKLSSGMRAQKSKSTAANSLTNIKTKLQNSTSSTKHRY